MILEFPMREGVRIVWRRGSPLNLKPAVAILLMIIFFLYAPPGSHASGENDLSAESRITEDDADADEASGFGGFDEFDSNAAAEVYDPLSGYNRVMTQVNDKIYFWVLKPVGQGYGWIVWKPIRLAIDRFYTNLSFPIRLVNNLLQAKVKRAGIETARFGVNTTVGVLGLFDPATSWLNLKAYPEDFGQTLGHYGVGSGFPLVLPVLGPYNLRDFCGIFPDLLMHPMMYFRGQNIDRYSWAVAVHDRINWVSLHIGEYESLRRDAVDLYIFLRDANEQNRNKLIEE